MQLALYYSPGACSLGAHIVLRELAIPFEPRRVTIAKGEHLAPEYLAVNPRGRVPTLVIDGQAVRELSGILTWLAHRAGKLFPPVGTLESARCSEWLAWLTSSVHISFALLWRGQRFIDEPAAYPALEVRGRAALTEQFAEIERALTNHEYVVGGQYSVVDANLLPLYRWGSRVGFAMRRDYPAWTAHTQRLLARPAVREAVEAEGIDMWPPVDEAFGRTRDRRPMTKTRLSEFSDAWARHDVNGLCAMITDDCVYSASVGPEPGETFKGADAVRKGFAQVIAHDEKGKRVAGPSWIFGNVGFAHWEFHFPQKSGAPRIVRGIDYFEFEGDRIRRKDAFRKVLV